MESRVVITPYYPTAKGFSKLHEYTMCIHADSAAHAALHACRACGADGVERLAAALLSAANKQQTLPGRLRALCRVGGEVYAVFDDENGHDARLNRNVLATAYVG